MKFSPAPGHRLRILCLTVTSLALGFAPAGHAASEPSPLNGQKKSYQYSWQQELEQGAQADKEITEQMGVYHDDNVQSYVQSLGERVLQASTFNDPNTPEMYRNTKFTFRVLDSTVVNAFALPGGYVYVTRGLLAHVDNEAQLAVVLGHEIAHVAARHSSQQARRSMWGQIGVIAGAILGQQVLGERMPDIGSTILNTGGPAMQTFLLKYSREAETEADTFGVNYALRAGYAAGDSARFFNSLKRISETEGKALPTWQSSHPDPGDRANRVRQLTASAGASNNLGTNEFLRHVEGLIVGDDPRQGFSQNGVFYHPELRFQIPVASGWKLDNQPAAVVMAEPNGKAMMGLRLAQETRGRDAAAQFVAKNKVQVTASGDTYVNGMPTAVIVGKATTEQGEVGVWNAFVEMDGKVYSILGYAPTQVFDQMRGTFETVAGGFSPLRDQSLASIQPAHLHVVRSDHAGAFASFVPTSLPPSITADELAIMNQVSLNQSVPAGQFLKIPDSGGVAPTVTANPYPDQNQAYPNQSTYPPRQTNPRQRRNPNNPYPPQQYPDNYPPQTYPPQSYPPAQPYPQQYPNPQPQYPQQTYPPQNYPPYPQQSPYPQQPGYPQYPQPQPSPQQQGPVWPR